MTKKKPKAPNKLSKKTLLLLFEQRKVPTDPEVKELGYRASSVRNYYSKWQSGKGEVSKAGNKLETPLPKGESMGGVAETAKLKPSPVSEALFIACNVTIQATVAFVLSLCETIEYPHYGSSAARDGKGAGR